MVAVAALAASGVLAGCGSGSGSGSATKGTRTVSVEMHDIAYSPDKIDVKAGEKVRFVFKNTGKVAHDAFIGDSKAQDDHEMEMRQGGGMAGMNHGGSDDAAITVEPGKTGELTHTFQMGETVIIGCHQPGHYAAGMKVTVNPT